MWILFNFLPCLKNIIIPKILISQNLAYPYFDFDPDMFLIIYIVVFSQNKLCVYSQAYIWHQACFPHSRFMFMITNKVIHGSWCLFLYIFMISDWQSCYYVLLILVSAFIFTVRDIVEVWNESFVFAVFAIQRFSIKHVTFTLSGGDGQQSHGVFAAQQTGQLHEPHSGRQRARGGRRGRRCQEENSQGNILYQIPETS